MSASLQYLPSIRLKLDSAAAKARGDMQTAIELASAAHVADEHEWDEIHAREGGGERER